MFAEILISAVLLYRSTQIEIPLFDNFVQFVEHFIPSKELLLIPPEISESEKDADV